MPTIIDVPLYEPLILGFPFYMFLIGVLGLILVFGLMIFKLEIYDRLEPVWGHRSASAHNSPEALVFGMSGKLRLLAVTEIAGVFSAMGLPLKWIQTVPSQGQLGKVNSIVVSDDWNIVSNIDVNYAIVEIVHKWNELHQEGTADHIFNWESFERPLMDGRIDNMYPDGIKLPPFRNVNLHEIKRYLPKWTASHHAGYINDEINKRRLEDDKQGMGMMKYAIIAAGIVMLASVMGYILLTSAK